MQTIRIWRLLVFLGLAGSFCAAETAIRTSDPISKIAPLAAQAYTSRVNITLELQPNESFQTLTRRAETVARAAAQRSFDNDILVTQAAVVVTAENSGLSAPILSLEVNRENWKNYPNAQRWSTYYPTTQALLRIQNPVPTVVETQPGRSPTNPTNSSGTGTSTPAPGTTVNPTATPSTVPNATPGTTPANRSNQNSGTKPAAAATGTPGTTPANRSNQNSGTKPAAAATGTGTTNRTGTANQRSNSANPTSNTRNTQRSNSANPTSNTQNTQRSNSATPANRTGTNNNQTSPSTQQTNTQPNNPPRSRSTSGQGLIHRTRDLKDDINNRPPIDVPQD